jgi:hypothetical protein
MQITKITFKAAAPRANQPSGYKEFRAIADSLKHKYKEIVVNPNPL